MTTKQDVEKVEAQLPATGFDYGQDAGAGFEGTKGSDLSVPFLGILQPLSPQVEGNDPEGAASGMLFNTVTRELLDGEKGVIVLPCHKEGPIWVEWVPRTKGGGFVGLHDPESEAVKNGEQILNQDTGKPTRRLRHGENELIETYYIYGLLLDEEGLATQGFAVISFTSTKIKPYRDWVTAMYTLKGRPPMFANRARLRTVKQKNDSGTFYNFRVDPFEKTWAASLINPATQPALLTEAKEFRDMVISGMARAAFETAQSTTGEGEGEGSGKEGEPPF